MRTFLIAGCLLAAIATAPTVQSQTRGLLGDDLGLLQITVGETVAYDFEIGGEARTLTYATPRRGVVEARVTDKGGRELVAVVASRRRSTVRVNGERVRLREGQSLYDVQFADASSVYLLRQNYIRSECIGLDWLQEVTADANDGELPPSTQEVFSIPGFITDVISDIIGGGGGGEDCTSSSATCTETDADGNSEVITFECDCGIAICHRQTISITVPAVDQYGFTTQHRQTTVVCVCGCLTPVRG